MGELFRNPQITGVMKSGQVEMGGNTNEHYQYNVLKNFNLKQEAQQRKTEEDMVEERDLRSDGKYELGLGEERFWIKRKCPGIFRQFLLLQEP